jgi:hypothetical protein
MDCTITSNLREFNNFDSWLYKRRQVRTLSFGNVYVNKSGAKKGEMVLRVSGVPMFVKSHRADAQVVVEIDEERSRDILVSNRDSLIGEYENELDEFLQEIATETTSALREWEPEERIVGQKNAATITRRRREPVKALAKPTPQPDPLDVLGYRDDQPEAEEAQDEQDDAPESDGVPDIFDDMHIEPNSDSSTAVATCTGGGNGFPRTVA